MGEPHRCRGTRNRPSAHVHYCSRHRPAARSRTAEGSEIWSVAGRDSVSGLHTMSGHCSRSASAHLLALSERLCAPLSGQEGVAPLNRCFLTILFRHTLAHQISLGNSGLCSLLLVGRHIIGCTLRFECCNVAWTVSACLDPFADPYLGLWPRGLFCSLVQVSPLHALLRAAVTIGYHSESYS